MPRGFADRQPGLHDRPPTQARVLARGKWLWVWPARAATSGLALRFDGAAQFADRRSSMSGACLSRNSSSESVGSSRAVCALLPELEAIVDRLGHRRPLREDVPLL